MGALAQIAADFGDKSAPCHLCGEARGLVLSHIIPAFVFRWLKETSATGYIRHTDSPNIRMQDGPKCYLLCRHCEETLSKAELEFSEKVFRPLNEVSAAKISYGEWMLRFAVSISWRVNRVLSFRPGASEDLGPTRFAQAKVADDVWRGYLTGQSVHPGDHEQHMLLLDYVTSANVRVVPPRLNQYIMRGVHFSVVDDGGDCFCTFAKFGKFLILGHLTRHPRKEWSGTRLALKRGWLQEGSTGVPGAVLGHLMQGAASVGPASEALSARQEKAIGEAMLRDVDKAAASGSFAAFSADSKLYGSKYS